MKMKSITIQAETDMTNAWLKKFVKKLEPHAAPQHFEVLQVEVNDFTEKKASRRLKR